MNYTALYRHPKWQKKRLEVMQKADFQCELCLTKNKTLNVHHKQYRKGAKPWEYELHELQCLCEDCHKYLHEKKAKILNLISQISDPMVLDSILGYLYYEVFSNPFLINKKMIQSIPANQSIHFLHTLMRQYKINTEDWYNKYEENERISHMRLLTLRREKYKEKIKYNLQEFIEMEEMQIEDIEIETGGNSNG